MKLFKKKEKTEDKRTEVQKVEERREEILARGRKFKYPLQYEKHKLVWNTIVISVVSLLLLVSIGGVALYKFQVTSDVMYRVTALIPVPVANVDGTNVRFSDYLMMFRSSLKAVEQQAGQLGGGTDATELKDDYKRVALDRAEEYAFAEKLVKEVNGEIKVTDEEVEKMFVEHRKVGGEERSEASFLKVLDSNFGLNKDEYKRLLYLSILKAKVEEMIDTNARNVAEKVEKMIASGMAYNAIAGQLGEDAVVYEETGGLVSNKNIDGGRSAKAVELEKGANSGKFLSSNGDGYYFVKLVDKSATQVNYVSIKVPFTEFDKQMQQVRDEGKIKEYIKL